MILVSKSVGAGAAHNVTCWTCYESPRVTAAASWRTQGAAAWQSAQMNFMVLEPQSRKLISPPRKPQAACPLRTLLLSAPLCTQHRSQ